ncbi:damage-inducible protein CinA [Photobacterium jeanii]|uniref:Damage-inducible protein CinA n=1 Tax=Photobacterium jeanii TaxID=858640 RepID=A0A178K7E3_9GAMM|nr:nicotinamide-nucleotide amidohydrolase family protein [Photobacterium jeanii]OAN12602.1 damage-inducible protein CinA [Photobacterium jeanii]PST86732.1 damage-inducible protein CinA [Photobacterium jeanii]
MIEDNVNRQIVDVAQGLGEDLQAQGWVATTAESCTGGGVSMAITEVAGSSAWFDRAFITYSNEAKMEMLGVTEQALIDQGAVSELVVTQMAQGALAHSAAQISVAISGIAGPSGGTETKPVGTVCFGWADTTGWYCTNTQIFTGDRAQVREQAVLFALQGMRDRLLSLG